MPRASLHSLVRPLLRRALPLVACTLVLSVGRTARLDAQDTTKTAPPVPVVGTTPAQTPAPAPQDSARAPQDTTKRTTPDSTKKPVAAPTAGDSAHATPAAPSTEPSVSPAGAPVSAPATAAGTSPAAGDSAKATVAAVPAAVVPSASTPAATAPAAAPAATAPAATAPAATAPAATAPAATAPATATDPHLNVPMPVVTAPPPVDTLPDANQHVQAASRMLEQGKVGAAIGELLQGVREDPTDIDTWVSLGDIYRQTGKTSLALETYAKALNVVSGAADALRVPYAELLFRSKKKAQAIEVLKKGIELDPEVSADMKSLLGRIIIDDMTVGESTDEVASDAAEPSTPEKAAAPTTTSAKKKAAAPKISVKKKKRLCKLFCPEDLKVPKK